MKRFLSVFFLLALVLSLVAFAYNGSETVYVTNTGTKYHVSGCSYLQSSNAVTLKQAVEAGYTPCSRCHPPIPDFEYAVQQELPEHKSGSGSGTGTTRSYSSGIYGAVAIPSPTPEQEKESSFSFGDLFDIVFILIFGVASWAVPTILGVIGKRNAEKERQQKQ